MGKYKKSQYFELKNSGAVKLGRKCMPSVMIAGLTIVVLRFNGLVYRDLLYFQENKKIISKCLLQLIHYILYHKVIATYPV